MRRRFSLHASPPSETSDSGTTPPRVYNPFPEIDDPTRRGYYLPLIDALYVPPSSNATATHAATWHELAHATLADTAYVCGLRAIMAALLGNIMLVLYSRDEGFRLRIPSLTLVKDGQPVGGRLADTIELLAESYDASIAGAEVVQELCAHVITSRILAWDVSTSRSKLELPVDAGDTHDRLYELYDILDVSGIALIAQYALNVPNTHTVDALQRMHAALRAADGLARHLLTNKDALSTLLKTVDMYGEDSGLADDMLLHLAMEYISKDIDGFSAACTTCPQRGECAHRVVEKAGVDLISQHPAAAATMLCLAQLMEYARCGREERFTEEHGPFAIRTTIRHGEQGEFKLPQWLAERQIQLRLTLVGDVDMPDVRVDSENHNVEVIPWPSLQLGLAEAEVNDYDFAIGVKPPHLSRMERELGFAVKDVSVAEMLLSLEAIRQQMWTGTGPMCVCYPDVREDCPVRTLLGQLWERTEPDPGSTWKQELPICLTDSGHSHDDPLG